MRSLLKFGKIALAAVFLLVLGCSGSDGFQPAPGATIEQDELQGLIAQALSGFDVEATTFTSLLIDANSRGYKSCFEVASGPCYIPRPPGMSASFQGSDGTSVLVNVMLAIDDVEAAGLVNNAVLSRATVSTRSLRTLYGGAPLPYKDTHGPCDTAADRKTDEGCAWEKTGAPEVGDEAWAMKSEILDGNALSMVAFQRAGVFASVEILKQGESQAPNRMAGDIAKAVDNQIKQALSQ